MSEDDDLKKHWDALTAGGREAQPPEHVSNEVCCDWSLRFQVWLGCKACLHQGLDQPVHLSGVLRRVEAGCSLFLSVIC